MTKIVIVTKDGEHYSRTVESWDLGFSIAHFAKSLHLDRDEILTAYVKAR